MGKAVACGSEKDVLLIATNFKIKCIFSLLKPVVAAHETWSIGSFYFDVDFPSKIVMALQIGNHFVLLRTRDQATWQRM